jgi:hypothetical protein
MFRPPEINTMIQEEFEDGIEGEYFLGDVPEVWASILL